jgi:hypothetical protein
MVVSLRGRSGGDCWVEFACVLLLYRLYFNVELLWGVPQHAVEVNEGPALQGGNHPHRGPREEKLAPHFFLAGKHPR